MSVFDHEIFEGKTVKSLFEDIYKSVYEEDSNIKSIIKNMENAMGIDENSNMDESERTSIISFLAPTLKDFADVSIKNKEQLIKMAGVIQKFIAFENKKEETEDMSDEEKRELQHIMNNLIQSQNDIKKNDIGTKA